MADVELRFNAPLNTATPVDLRFGAPLVEVDESNLTLSATLPAPTLSSSLQRVRAVALAATLPPPTLSSSIHYDNAVYRGMDEAVGSHWEVAAHLVAGKTISHQVTATFQITAKQSWQRAKAAGAIAPLPWQSGIHKAVARTPTWQESIPLKRATTAGHKTLSRCRNDLTPAWENADQVASDHDASWQDRFRRPRPDAITGWQDGDQVGAERVTHSQIATPLAKDDNTHWQTARKPPAGRYNWIFPPLPVDVCYHPPTGNNVPLLFKDAFTTDADILFHCEQSAVIPPTATVVVPVKRTYIVINDAQLLRVDGNHTLPTYSLSLNIDMDSWTWGFNASLPASALSLIEPDSAGDPVILKAVINGASYLLLAESIQRDRTFGTSRISVSGRGRSAMLSDPYSPLLTFANASDRTAQQLMADALTINDTSIGWDIDWRITDWLVPAGAWNHQGSYMSAVNAIAAAAGAFIQPDPVNQILRVRPRYPVAPWDWYGAAVTPDLELPAAVISKEGIAWTERPAYNAVYVSGTTAGGILGHVKRSGSAGDIIAPMITDALITHADAARQRGLNVLADTGRSATYTLSLPVLPETGIIDPGTLVRYVDNGNPTVGVVKGVSVTVGLPKVQQTIEVQTHG